MKPKEFMIIIFRAEVYGWGLILKMSAKMFFEISEVVR